MISKMFLSALLILGLAGIGSQQVVSVFTQTRSHRPNSRPKTVRHHRTAENRKVKGDPFVMDLQMTTLKRIFLKYDGNEIPTFIWYNDQIWWDLYKNRGDLDALLKSGMDSPRSIGVWSTQYEMEDAVLSLLASNQLEFLAYELELTDSQVDAVEKVVRYDVMRKHQIFRVLWPQPACDLLFEQIGAVSDGTDVKLKRILFQEQFKEYQRIKADAFRLSSGRLAVNKPPSLKHSKFIATLNNV